VCCVIGCRAVVACRSCTSLERLVKCAQPYSMAHNGGVKTHNDWMCLVHASEVAHECSDACDASCLLRVCPACDRYAKQQQQHQQHQHLNRQGGGTTLMDRLSRSKSSSSSSSTSYADVLRKHKQQYQDEEEDDDVTFTANPLRSGEQATKDGENEEEFEMQQYNADVNYLSASSSSSTSSSSSSHFDGVKFERSKSKNKAGDQEEEEGEEGEGEEEDEEGGWDQRNPLDDSRKLYEYDEGDDGEEEEDDEGVDIDDPYGEHVQMMNAFARQTSRHQGPDESMLKQHALNSFLAASASASASGLPAELFQNRSVQDFYEQINSDFEKNAARGVSGVDEDEYTQYAMLWDAGTQRLRRDLSLEAAAEQADDDRRAIAFFKQAAQRGHVSSLRVVADAWLTGRGMSDDGSSRGRPLRALSVVWSIPHFDEDESCLQTAYDAINALAVMDPLVDNERCEAAEEARARAVAKGQGPAGRGYSGALFDLSSPLLPSIKQEVVRAVANKLPEPSQFVSDECDDGKADAEPGEDDLPWLTQALVLVMRRGAEIGHPELTVQLCHAAYRRAHRLHAHPHAVLKMLNAILGVDKDPQPRMTKDGAVRVWPSSAVDPGVRGMAHLVSAFILSDLYLHQKFGFDARSPDKLSKQQLEALANWRMSDLVQDHLKSAMRLDFDEATMVLATAYETGEGLERNPDNVFDIYSALADKGSTDAVAGLARCYEHGLGVKADPERALELYQQCFESPFAQFSLSRAYDPQPPSPLPFGPSSPFYHSSLPVEPNARKAFELCLEAAKAGVKEARVRLAYYYETGLQDGEWSVAANADESDKWLARAANHLDAHAQLKLYGASA